MKPKDTIRASLIDREHLKHKQLTKLGIFTTATLLLTAFLSPANAVEFFKDDFERTSLNDTRGAWGNIQQNQISSGSDVYKVTRVWTGGPNGIEIQANGVDGFNAYNGRHRVELDTGANSWMSTKVNLVNGQNYTISFQYRSRPKTTTTTKCVLIVFCSPVTTTTYVGGGVRASVESPSYTTGYFQVGDVSSWTKGSTSFTYQGATGEATIKFEATGTSDGMGTVIDDISLSTSIPGDATKPEALTGILPPHVPGMLSQDSNRSDIITPIVTNKQAAIALGKALFWEQGVGSDQMACASCHFSAGADMRVKNQIDPGLSHPAASGSTFENTVSGNKSGPNYTLTKADFPFNPNIDDVASSSGTFSGDYKSSPTGVNEDDCARSVNSVFHVNGVGTRNVEPRNTPTMINAAYNHRNFWDGRATNEFNGVSPFGSRDSAAGVFINKSTGLTKERLKLKNASLASQAVGPPGSDFEMACRGRKFADVGRKLLNRKPLALQSIAADDSVLSSLPSNITYAALIQSAFASAYWNGNCGSNCGTPSAGVSPSTPYSQIEANFSMFFGIAVQMYEETLVSDDTRFDKWKRGLLSPTAEESRGESVFNGQGKCASCHNGPTMTSAALLHKNKNVIQGMLMQNGRKAVYDEGFYNTAVVPTAHDLGNGGVDPWNNPLSFTRQYLSGKFVDDFGFDSCTFEDSSPDLCSSNDSAAARSTYSSAVDGAFKTPTLRNIALTGPYMHNGAQATLEQVVEFYNRGGNFGTSTNPDKHPDIQPLGLSTQQKSDLVAFMKAFTDDRVLYQKAPFDHPSLMVPNGHVGNEKAVTAGNYLFAGFAQDEVLTLPPVGKNGSSQPLPTFMDVLPAGIPAVNALPTVAITAPAANASIRWGTLVNITASAADSDGIIARVEFYAGSSLIGTDATAPYSVTASMPLSTITLTAKAFDNAGASKTSAPITVTGKLL